MASLDASKAFDRINHEKLFVKLFERGAPQCLISVLENWYIIAQTHGLAEPVRVPLMISFCFDLSVYCIDALALTCS